MELDKSLTPLPGWSAGRKEWDKPPHPNPAPRLQCQMGRVEQAGAEAELGLDAKWVGCGPWTPTHGYTPDWE